MLIKQLVVKVWWLHDGNHFRDSSQLYLVDSVLSSAYSHIISDDFLIKKQFDSLSLTFCLI